MSRTITFIKKHPWLLAKCISFMAFVCSFLTKRLSSAMLIMINLKGLNLSPPPPSPPPPTLDKMWKYGKYVGTVPPYQPSWVKASLKDPYQHPVIKSRIAIAEKKKAAEAEKLAKQKAVEEQAKQSTIPDLLPQIPEQTIVGPDRGDQK
jgi:hypothetical protein